MFTPQLESLLKLNRRRMAIVGASAVLALVGRGTSAADPAPATVRLVVDYGDGVEVHFKALRWREGMTVLDALTAAKSHPRGIAFSQRGSGSSAMITAIGGLQNEGAGEKSKNWLYYVNAKAAEVGAGVLKLKPGDVVLWKFQVYDYNS